MLTPGSKISHYEILSRLGEGGMGEVYRARDLNLGRDVAIKVLRRDLGRDDEAIARFEREARAATALNHPHIVTIYDIGRTRLKGDFHSTRFIVMELIEGQTLRRFFDDHRSLNVILNYLAQAADALAKAHSAGILHRDLKPENILISIDGYAKLVDFGLAKLIEEKRFGRNEQTETAKYITEKGLALGTPGYMSPEQIYGQPTDRRSDVFSFGCMLYEALSGRPPFEAGHYAETMHQVLHQRHAPLPESIPPDLRELVDRCLEKNPEDRFESMRGIAPRLRDAAATLSAGVTARATTRRTARSSTRTKSVAVLPFENASGDAEMDYLSDGLTESIIHTLSPLRRLKVMARSTVFTYKGKDVTPQQIGRDLNVTSLVTGRVQRIGDTLLLSIELVNAEDGALLWGVQYRRQMSDIFEVQEEIRSQIIDKLKLHLAPLEKRRLARRGTSEAFELYLKGRFHANKRTVGDLTKAIEYFQQAIGVDARYAPAFAGLASSYMILSAKGFVSPREGYWKVEEAAAKAIALDPALAEPHAALANHDFLHKWNWKAAEREYLEAIRLDRNYATGHHWYSIYLTCMERHEEAIAEAARALDLDPLSPLLHVHLADTLHYAGRDDEAMEECEKALALDGTFFWAHLVLGRCLESKGRFDLAAAEFEKGIAKGGRYPELLASLAYARARSGDRQEPARVLRELEEMAQTQFLSPLFVAEIHAGMGERDRALQSLERFLRIRPGELAEVLVGRRFAEVREDARFPQLLAAVGFPTAAMKP